MCPIPDSGDIHNKHIGDVSGGLIQAGSIENLTVEVYGPVPAPASAPAPNSPPVMVTASTEEPKLTDSLWIVDIDDSEADRLPEPGSPEWAELLHAHTLDLPRYDRLNLHIEGLGPQAVALRSLRFHIENRLPPRGMVLHVTGRPLFGAALIPRWFKVDLSSGTDIRPTPASDNVSDFPYTVHQSDPEWFVIDLYWGTEDLEFVVELDWMCAGRSGTVRVDNDGAPFRTTTIHGRPSHTWNIDQPSLGWH